MPPIPRAFAQVQLPGTIDVRRPNTALLGAPGRALSQIGAAMEVEAEAEAREVEKAHAEQVRLDDGNIITEALGVYSRKAGEESMRRQVEQDLTSPEYTRDFDKWAVEAMQGLPGVENLSPAGQERLGGLLETVRTSHYKANLALQGDATKAKRGRQIEEFHNGAAAAVFANPGFLPAVLKGWGEQMDLYRETPAFPLAEWRAERAVGRAELIETAVLGRLDRGEFERAREILRHEAYEKDIDGGRRAQLEAKITTAEKVQARADRAAAAGAVRDAKRDAQHLMRQMGEGYQVDGGRLAALGEKIRANGGAADPVYGDILAAVEVSNSFDELRAMPPAVLSNWIMQAEGQVAAQGGQASAAQQALLKFGRDLYGEMRARKNTDPVGLFNRLLPGVDAGPIEFSGENALGSMQARRQTAEAAGDHFGIPPVYLRPEERENLEKYLKEATGDEMFAVAAMIHEGFGGVADHVFEEISDNSGAFAFLSGLSMMSAGHARGASLGYEGLWRQGRGQKLVYADEGEKSDKAAITRDVLGGALRLLPGARAQLEEAAEAIMLALAWQQEEKAGTYDAELWTEALSLAAGRVTVKGMDFGGVAEHNGDKFILPADLSADGAEAALDWLSDDYLRSVNGGELPVDLSGAAVDAERIRDDGRLVMFDLGRYFIDLGGARFGQYAGSKQGIDDRFLLDLGALAAAADLDAEQKARAEAEAAAMARAADEAAAAAKDSPAADEVELDLSAAEIRQQLADAEGARAKLLARGAAEDSDDVIAADSLITFLRQRIAASGGGQ